MKRPTWFLTLLLLHSPLWAKDGQTEPLALTSVPDSALQNQDLATQGWEYFRVQAFGPLAFIPALPFQGEAGGQESLFIPAIRESVPERPNGLWLSAIGLGCLLASARRRI